MPIELQVKERRVVYKAMICDIEPEYPISGNLSHAPTRREKEVILDLDGDDGPRTI